MILGIDFDGTIVRQDRRYDDITTPLEFMSGAKEGLYALKKAGHKLVLWSARANLALRRNDPALDPMVVAGIKRSRPDRDSKINELRFQQMLLFVDKELPDIFDYVFSGGEIDKPQFDMIIDNIAIGFGGALGHPWKTIANIYGEPDYGRR